MKKLHCAAALAVACAFVAAGASASSFIVPTDRDLVHASKAIVIAKGVTSYAVQGDGDMIDTVFELDVEEVIKGDIRMDERLRLVEPGGFIGQRGILVPGAVGYRAGERALIFLDTREDGNWRTSSMVVGKFNFVRDLHGTRLLMRGQDEGAIFGWSAAGDAHQEVIRAEEKFLQYVRAEACGGVGDVSYSVDESTLVWQPKVKAAVNGSGFHACDYVFPGFGGGGGNCGAKWKDIFDQPGGAGSVGFSIVGTQSGGVNGNNAASAGANAWNSNSLSNVNLSIGSGSCGIHFDDNSGTAVCGGAAVGCTLVAVNGSPFTFDGGMFAPIVQAQVSIKAAFTGNQSLLDQIVCHELGHAIGFRHSGDSTPVASTAVMMGVANAGSPFGANLQSWDTDAVQTVYNPNPSGACVNVGVPTASANPPTINSGNSSLLSASASGSTPITFNWFVGAPGNTSTPAGTGASVSVSPTTTTSYWVRATGQCGPTQNSTGVTVTVNPACPLPQITGQPGSTVITPGNSTTLSVSANSGTTLSYQWFIGTAPTGSPTGTNSPSLMVSPTTTTNYFVRVTNTCGSVDSQTATVTVQACSAPANAQAGASPPSVSPGGSTNLSVTVSGSNPFTFQWFIGNSGDTTNPINGATSSIVQVSPNGTTTYWVKVSNGCGNTNSTAVTVNVVTGCNGAHITQQPQGTSITPGGSTTLTVTATGDAPLTFAWFIGTPPTGTATGTNSSSLLVNPSATTTYFVRVSNACGSETSVAAIVVVSATCAPATIVTPPASKSVPLGISATLSVVASGKAPLTFKWFEGVKPDASKQVGSSQTLTTAPITKVTNFWVRVTNECGEADGNTVTVSPVRPPRGRAVKH